jgi:hypothetical protein
MIYHQGPELDQKLFWGINFVTHLRNADGKTYTDLCGADSAVTNDNVLQLLTSAGARKNQARGVIRVHFAGLKNLQEVILTLTPPLASSICVNRRPFPWPRKDTGSSLQRIWHGQSTGVCLLHKNTLWARRPSRHKCREYANMQLWRRLQLGEMRVCCAVRKGFLQLGGASRSFCRSGHRKMPSSRWFLFCSGIWEIFKWFTNVPIYAAVIHENAAIERQQ